MSVQCARPRPSPPAAAVGDPLPPDRALRRWVRGHHAFFVLIQGLLLGHEQLVRAMRAGQPLRIQAMLDWTVELWWASAAAFRLAGDFDAHAYATVVRPSMSSPHVSEGFSGLHSADHTELIGMLKATRSAIEDRCVTHPAEHRSYLWALSSVYDSHVYVCEEFVGDGSSLKSSGSRYGARATAVLAGPLKRARDVRRRRRPERHRGWPTARCSRRVPFCPCHKERICRPRRTPRRHCWSGRR